MQDAAKAWNERLALASQSAAKALQKEREGDLVTAYSLCLQTAQSYLWLIRNTEDTAAKDKLKAASAKLLVRAEKIKAVRPQASPAPVSFLNELEQAEVLERSAFIDKQRYPIWSENLKTDVAGDSQYSDPFGHFPLSKQQQAELHSFKRMSDLASSPKILSTETLATAIIQNCVTDCSVITALIACLHHHNRFESKLGVKALFPQDETGWPQYSKVGMYYVKLHCNGAARQVTIDDYFPINANNTPLCATLHLEQEFWPACLEKAYVKLHGGYQIPGSDPSIDIYAFTGWIPEQIVFNHPSFRSEQTWTRLCKAFSQGTCLVTLGTGERPVKLNQGELASKHAYAVLSLIDGSTEDRYLEIIDPWLLGSDEPASDNTYQPEQRIRKLSWDSVCTNFSSVYCNWDPQCFDHISTVHLACPQDDSLSLAIQLGPSASIDGDEVWLLISRHLETSHAKEYVAIQVSELPNSSGAQASRPVASVEFTDSAHILVKVKLHRPQSRLALLVSRKHSPRDLRLSVTCYSTCEYYFMDMSAAMPNMRTVKERWHGKSAGGNPSLVSYIHNPQYTFTIAPNMAKLELAVTLRTRNDLAVNVKLLKVDARGVLERIQQLETSVIMADSSKGTYTHGVASLLASQLSPGTYILLPSAFAAGEEAPFTLEVQTSSPIALTALPQEDAGKFTRTLHGQWSAKTAGGCGKYPTYNDNPRFLLQAPVTRRLRMRLTALPNTTPVRLAVHCVQPDRSAGEEVASTGPYAAFVSGCSSSEVRLKASGTGYYLIPSTFNPGTEASFDISLISDGPLDVRGVT